MTQFYDAARWPNIPHGSDAMLYFDGSFRAPLSAPSVLGLNRYRWITVLGDYHHAGAIDWEPGNPCFTPGALRAYVAGRRDMGARARVYVQRSLVSAALAALDAPEGPGDLATFPGLLWWIPTLDDHQLTAVQLQADLADHWNALLPLSALWAQQWTQIPELGAGALADQSVLYGTW
jgi:hypothetical protein